MRRYITEYIKNCLDCQSYKAINLKPSGLLQTPAPAQRFEIIAVDLFGPLPETKEQNRCILVCEDTASKWVELFAIKDATAEACAKLLIEQIFLRYGTLRKMITDNGFQFISDVMQKVTYSFVRAENFVPRITPYLTKVACVLQDSIEKLTLEQDRSKKNADKARSSSKFAVGEKVMLKTHMLSNKVKGLSSKFAPKRDGPYTIKEMVTPTSYLLSTCDNKAEETRRYHSSDITHFHQKLGGTHDSVPVPIVHKRKRKR